jgi:parallel beta-helix repeat protein
MTRWMPAKKKTLILTTLALSVIWFSSVWMLNLPSGSASQIIMVPQDYSTIAAAISHASAGDTVLVQSGVYNENLQIGKPLILLGQDPSSTVIVGAGGSSPSAVISLTADDVTVSGLTITSQTYKNTSQTAYGIWVQANNCAITGNIITGTYIGLWGATASSTTINNNIVKSNIKDGIRFYSGSQNTVSDNNITGNAGSGAILDGYQNTITNNTLTGNFRGVGLGASYSLLFGNTIQSNNESGIFLDGSQNMIFQNTVEANKYGVFVTQQLTGPTGNRIFHNNFQQDYINAFDNSSGLIEVWDNGSLGGGNFWSDKQTTPYVINSNNQDNYPLTAPFNIGNLSALPTLDAPVQKIDSVLACWTFDSVDTGLVTPDQTGNNPAVLGSMTKTYNFTPAVIPGKFGNAFRFDGNTFAGVHTSATLQTQNEVTIDAWVNVPEIKNVSYNNILIEAVRTPTTVYPVRTLGLAVNGEAPQNASSSPLGALRGYVATSSGLNEIDTTKALPFNTWVHVVFVRSLTTGMHLYVDGKEQTVTVSAGSVNPTGAILQPTDIYIGHDSQTEIDQLQITNSSQPLDPSIWTQWLLWTAIILVAVTTTGLWLAFHSQRRKR